MVDQNADLIALMEPVARAIWGDPNRSMSSKVELRFGSHGSLSVDIRKGTYFDHEMKEGGGVLDALKKHAGCQSDREAFEWLEEKQLWVDGRAHVPRPRRNGQDGHTHVRVDNRKRPPPKGEVIAEYDYVDEQGEFLFQVQRWFDKATGERDFRQRHRDARGQWVDHIRGCRRVPYRLPELLEALAQDRTIVIVEGEKDTDNCIAHLNLPATNNPMGAGKWPIMAHELNVFFQDADVIIVADNDPQTKNKKTGELLFHPDGRPVFAGQDHAHEVAAILSTVARRVRVLDLGKRWKECPLKGDMTNWIEAGRTADQFWDIVEQLPDWTPDQQKSELEDQQPHPDRIEYVDIAKDPIPDRPWAVKDRIPSANVTLVSGEGAVGKTILLLQLAAATVLAKDWIGTMPEPGPVLFWSCEDDDDEVCRRLELIARHYQVTRADLASSGLHVVSRVGLDSVLGAPDRNNLIQPTKLFAELRQEVERIKPVLIVIDTAADTFAGNEISRAQTRQYITILRSLAVIHGAAVILTAHPSLSGIASDSGLSGSTAWHNSVRARMYFKHASKDNPALRVLEVKKNNYGPEAENVSLVWEAGAYVFPKTKDVVEKSNVDFVFLTVLRRFLSEGRNVTDRPGTTFAPSLFADQPEAKLAKLSKIELTDCMQRLFASKRIKLEWSGPKSRQRSRLIEVGRPSTANSTPYSTDLPPDSTDTDTGNGMENNASTTVPPFPPEMLPLPPTPPHVPPAGGTNGGNTGARASGGSSGGSTVKVVGPAPKDAVCVHCMKPGRVVMATDGSPGAKPETLHMGCASAWFAKLKGD